MTNKGSENRSSKVAKSGKRSGNFMFPPSPNPEKQAASERGEQQFTAKAQQHVEKVKTVLDKNKMRFVNKTIAVSVDYTYDSTRKRLVRSPVTEKDK